MILEYTNKLALDLSYSMMFKYNIICEHAY